MVLPAAGAALTGLGIGAPGIAALGGADGADPSAPAVVRAATAPVCGALDDDRADADATPVVGRAPAVPLAGEGLTGRAPPGPPAGRPVAVATAGAAPVPAVGGAVGDPADRAVPSP